MAGIKLLPKCHFIGGHLLAMAACCAPVHDPMHNADSAWKQNGIVKTGSIPNHCLLKV